MKTEDALKPRIYIACLAAYTAGVLHGQWTDAAQDTAALQEAVNEVLATSPQPLAEEWAIHDYEGFGQISLGEYTPLDEVSRLGLLIEEHGEAFTAFVAYIGDEYATEDGFLDAYRGRWDSEEEYASELFDDVFGSQISDDVRRYIDYEAFARDLFMGDYFSVECTSGGVYVFSNC